MRATKSDVTEEDRMVFSSRLYSPAQRFRLEEFFDDLRP